MKTQKAIKKLESDILALINEALMEKIRVTARTKNIDDNLLQTKNV